MEWFPRSSGSIFLSTPSSRRATQSSGVSQVLQKISIHALLAEGDTEFSQAEADIKISIHALLAEGDSKLADKIGIIIS